MRAPHSVLTRRSSDLTIEIFDIVEIISRVSVCAWTTIFNSRSKRFGRRTSKSKAVARRPTSVLSIAATILRSEEHTSELQSLMRISYAVFCLNKKQNENKHTYI